MSNLPFDGAISEFYKKKAPDPVREAIKDADGKPILQGSYPYEDRMDKDEYEETLHKLQIELVKLQAWAANSKERIAIVFEGRDTAGKGGAIKRFMEYMNPRSARVVALSAPTSREVNQWYFQRYVEQMPAGGEICLFDRSWYNRGVVEHVFGFCTKAERQAFFRQLPDFEKLLVEDGIKLFKIWLNISQAEQLNRMLSREHDPLKQWKLSKIDVDGLNFWDEYSEAISETLHLTHEIYAPWTVIRADDKRRARIAAIRLVLSQIEYEGKKPKVVGEVDAAICGGPALIHA
ncbi:polyphosphate kinase 2 [Tropicimonas isoalkanivorans]|uniref:ADP/GDP-polyphosphate phosphotransferase n=1 Tax=Tropicimonas isoalkanivorans TaxID=441112 RepID=A0A1I1EIW8_9RHOB|nr:polyphosphate kinase 2 [Tropicimonas isoalkanivorans]SFB84893.1 polyphosphate kinase 2, PA0141 family [Tropicimonas isoalkanivorans]